jgi:hypothetical protein
VTGAKYDENKGFLPSEVTMIYEFQVVLKEGTEITEELADELFEAGCDDGTPGTSCGIPDIWFHREPENLESAIRSAVADVRKAGCVVERVQIDRDSPLLSGGAD